MAERLQKLNPKVTFIGPPPFAMRSLGDKIASTIVAQSAMVPCVNWSGQGIVFEKSPTSLQTVPDELYVKATVKNEKEGLMHAKRIGFPVMIKGINFFKF